MFSPVAVSPSSLNTPLSFPFYPFFSRSAPPLSKTRVFPRFPRSTAIQASIFEPLFVEESKGGRGDEMTISSSVRISDGKLVVHGRTILAGVSDCVVSSSAVVSGPVDGVFLGAHFAEARSSHVVSLGTLRCLILCFKEKSVLCFAVYLLKFVILILI